MKGDVVCASQATGADKKKSGLHSTHRGRSFSNQESVSQNLYNLCYARITVVTMVTQLAPEGIRCQKAAVAPADRDVSNLVRLPTGVPCKM